jgi:hypothetical protein
VWDDTRYVLVAQVVVAQLLNDWPDASICDICDQNVLNVYISFNVGYTIRILLYAYAPVHLIPHL